MSDNKNELVAMPDFSMIPAVSQELLEMKAVIKVPVAEIDSLGVVLGGPIKALLEAHDGLFRVTDAAGRPLSPGDLFKFGDGSGNLGSFKDAMGLHQARLNKVGEAELAASAINPTMLFVAAALMEINHKLDEISETTKEILDYLKVRDRAELIAGIKTLNEVRETYRFNSDNEAWLSERRVAVGRIRDNARRQIEQHSKSLEGKLDALNEFHVVVDQGKNNEVVEVLKDLQTACYLYAYAKVEDVLLMRSYDAGYLAEITKDLRSYKKSYKKLYDRSVRSVQGHANDAIGTIAAGALGVAASAVGEFVKATPVGDATPIDEGLIRAGKALEGIGVKDAANSSKKIAFGRPSFMNPFIESVENLNRMHNEPVVLAMGDDAVFVLPANAVELDSGQQKSEEKKLGE